MLREHAWDNIIIIITRPSAAAIDWKLRSCKTRAIHDSIETERRRSGIQHTTDRFVAQILARRAVVAVVVVVAGICIGVLTPRMGSHTSHLGSPIFPQPGGPRLDGRTGSTLQQQSCTSSRLAVVSEFNNQQPPSVAGLRTNRLTICARLLVGWSVGVFVIKIKFD